MKNLTKNTVFFILVAIVMLFGVTCVGSEPEDLDDDDFTYGPKYLGKKLDVKGEQVWMSNPNTGKDSEMLLKFTGDRDVDIIVDYPTEQIIVSGKITKGILQFKIDEDEMDTYLLDTDDLSSHFFKDWDVDSNISITPTDVKGNIITVLTYKKGDTHTTPIEAVIREGFTVTDTSFTGEYIYYIYVDKNCTISAGKTENASLDYTFNSFNMSLKTGWNTIRRSETYTTTGKSSYSISLSNPSISWVIQKIKNN